MRSSSSRHPNYFQFVYEESATLWSKMKAVATRIYGASRSRSDSKVRAQIRQCRTQGTGTIRS